MNLLMIAILPNFTYVKYYTYCTLRIYLDKQYMMMHSVWEQSPMSFSTELSIIPKHSHVLNRCGVLYFSTLACSTIFPLEDIAL